ncbi:haloacid dehalogenase-like hydrolase domain-containing protein 2 [Leptotrombidium deliense]|uniref:Haloacid dehalogenase-like hydrolase domain-containing protein 2 n=1 Tax=Leptotrombidium deliense TaxID=299467 RepID=A0A443S858_9ACAR|nr:haloacid dehalogenase-like hydrolase domain-containing protein 2 [Leptotrombidium deliense]
MKSLSKVKSLLIDLSGTIHVDDTAIQGAVEAIQRVKSSPIKIRFATNTTKESQSYLWNRLNSLGFNIKIDEIFTSLTLARDLIVEKNLKPFLLLEDSAMDDFRNYVDVNISSEKADSVVVGLAPKRFSYDYMNTAFRILHRGAPLIAVHKGRYYKRKDGLALGPGPFVMALEYASDVKAQVIGKPEATFFKSAIKPFNCETDEVAMIGDVCYLFLSFCTHFSNLKDVRDDIHGAQSVGMIGMLVKTGKYQEGDENKINPQPDFVFNSVVEAIDAILKETSNL